MKKKLRHWAVAAAITAAALAFTSCAYDPYYSTAGVGYSSGGGSYNSGYGHGYGYGGSNFTTSFFVSTGDPRWGYDPYCYSYYDYHRRCYYDPYLYGYYPIGYRPRMIVGCPHPYGWRPGYGTCRPPQYVRNTTVVNYHNREQAYRNSNYGWAKQVRHQPVSQGRVNDQHPARNTYRGSVNGSNPSGNQNNHGGSATGSRPSHGYSTPQSRSHSPQAVKPGVREQHNGRLPATYNTPVTRESSPKYRSSQRSMTNANGSRSGTRMSQPASPQAKDKTFRKEESRPANEGTKDKKNPIRRLGQV